MAPLRRKATTNVPLSHITIKKHIAKQNRAAPTSAQKVVSTILHHIAAFSVEHLTHFELARNSSPLVVQCANINTTAYSWGSAKAQHKAQIEHSQSTDTRSKHQYSTPGRKTRVWVPRWPNENPAVADNTEPIPEDKHDKSREAIVRAVQDQEDATRKVFKLMKLSLRYLPGSEVKGLMREHFELALRLQGIEVIDWKSRCAGWEMEVFFQEAKSWKGDWGL